MLYTRARGCCRICIWSDWFNAVTLGYHTCLERCMRVRRFWVGCKSLLSPPRSSVLSAVEIFLADFAVQKTHCPRRSLNLPSWPTRSRRGDHSVLSRAPPADSASRLGARPYARKISTATSPFSLCAYTVRLLLTEARRLTSCL